VIFLRMNLSESQFESGNLPKGWTTLRLGDVCYVQGGFAFKSGDYQDKGIPLVRISNIEDNRVNLKTEAVYLNPAFKKTASDFLLKKDDILIALSGATTGKFGIFGSNEEALLNQRVGRIRPYSDDIPNKYLFYYLGIIRKNILRQAYGAAQPNISTTELSEFPLPLSPLNEQKRIVAKIDELFTRLDAGVEALEKIKKELKRYRQSVLKSAFEGKLTEQWRKENKGKLEPASKLLERIAKEREKTTKGKQKKLPPPCLPASASGRRQVDKSNLPELPKGWEWAKIGYLCDVVRGGSPRPAGSPKYYNGKIPFLKVADITKDNCPYVNSFEYTIKEAGLRKTRKIPPNTLLLSNSGATLGVPKICMIEATFNDGIAAFLGLKKENLLFYYYFWLNKTKALRNINQGAAQPNLNTGLISDINMPLCSEKEQTQIISEIERHFSIADEVEQTIEKCLKESDRLRQSILKRAFEGKLVPQDPTDEPAEELLERIKAEKTKLKTEQKKRGRS
jgi:type I restriction enzyme, S subunit